MKRVSYFALPPPYLSRERVRNTENKVLMDSIGKPKRLDSSYRTLWVRDTCDLPDWTMCQAPSPHAHLNTTIMNTEAMSCIVYNISWSCTMYSYQWDQYQSSKSTRWSSAQNVIIVTKPRLRWYIQQPPSHTLLEFAEQPTPPRPHPLPRYSP